MRLSLYVKVVIWRSSSVGDIFLRNIYCVLKVIFLKGHMTHWWEVPGCSLFYALHILWRIYGNSLQHGRTRQRISPQLHIAKSIQQSRLPRLGVPFGHCRKGALMGGSDPRHPRETFYSPLHARQDGAETPEHRAAVSGAFCDLFF